MENHSPTSSAATKESRCKGNNRQEAGNTNRSCNLLRFCALVAFVQQGDFLGHFPVRCTDKKQDALV